jgi:hypothetical protein
MQNRLITHLMRCDYMKTSNFKKKYAGIVQKFQSMVDDTVEVGIKLFLTYFLRSCIGTYHYHIRTIQYCHFVVLRY